MTDWYNPRECIFTRKTALWLVQNLGALRAGTWPSDASNYIDIPGTKSVSHRAPFATPIEYAAEIEQRLEKCVTGNIPDGLILLALECWGESVQSLSRYFHMPKFSILKRRKQALGYVSSGPSRRWITTKKQEGETYQQFKIRRLASK